MLDGEKELVISLIFNDFAFYAIAFYYIGTWGKREPGWNNLKGLWGKRSTNWNKLSSAWGKRSV